MKSQRKKTRCSSHESQRQPRRGRQLVGELLEPRYLLAGAPHLLADIVDGATGSAPEDFVVVGDKTYFTVNGSEIWKTDGTTSGTVLVKDLAEGSGYAYWSYTDLHDHNGTLVAATYPQFVLWSSDGTADGTRVVKDFGDNYSVGISSSVEFTTAGDTLFFLLEDNDTGATAVWKSDLTEDGTSCITSALLTAWELKNVGSTLYFSAFDEDHGWELWKSDGTESGTSLVRDIYPGSSEYYGSSYANSSFPRHKEGRDGKLYFVASDEEHGRELWRSDGTEAGTVLVKDIVPGPDSGYPSTFLANVGGTLYFAADDGVHGTELWKSDGTSAGTSIVKDISPGSASSDPFGYYGYYGNLVGSLSGQLIFSADDGTHGRELWKSDGTPDGTMLIKDILPGVEASYPGASSGFATVQGRVYFAADDGGQGSELWESDGTPSGTRLVADVFPGDDEGYPNSSYPRYLTAAGGMLIYAADDGVHGREPWVVWVETGLAITPDGDRLMAEDLPTAGFSMSLKSPPAADVTVTLTPSAPDTALVNPLVVTFNSDNWQVPQTVSVGSSQSSGLRDFSIDATLSSDDSDYQQVVAPLLCVDLFPWHNPGNPLDTNSDEYTTPIDALLVINYLNTLPEDRPMTVGRFLDVNLDEYVTPIDALRIINYLNQGGGEGEGEGDMSVSSAATQYMPVTQQLTGVEWPQRTSLVHAYAFVLRSAPAWSAPQLPVLTRLETGPPSDDLSAYARAETDWGPPWTVRDLEFELDISTTEFAGAYHDQEEWQELLRAGRIRR